MPSLKVGLVACVMLISACSGAGEDGGAAAEGTEPSGSNAADPTGSNGTPGGAQAGDPDVAKTTPKLSIKAPSELVIGRGAPQKLVVEVIREGAPTDAKIAVTSLPTGISAMPITVPAGSASGELVFTATDAAAATPATVKIEATSGALVATTTLKVSAPRGAVDPSFGTAGKVTLPFNARDFVALPDGRLLTIGDEKTSNSSAPIVRMLAADGTTDATFASAGSIRPVVPNSASSSAAVALAAKGDGTFYALFTTSFYSPFRNRPVVIHLLADGSVDATFGAAGYAVADFDGFVYATASGIAVEPSGKIVVSASAYNGTGDDVHHAAVARLMTNGGLDTTFGEGGRLTTTWNGASALANGVRVLEGKTYVFGQGPYVSGRYTGIVTRITDSGALDATFGVGGIVKATLAVDDMALTPAGKILVRTSSGYDGVIQQLSTDGSADTAFGAKSYILETSPLPDIGYARDPLPFVIDAAGNVFTLIGSLYKSEVEIWSFDANGGRRTSFAGSGRLIVATGDDPVPRTMRAAAGGRYVGLASTSDSFAYSSALVRFFP